MRAYDIILRKRQGEELTTEEIRWFISSYMLGEVAEYQMAAMLMAIYFQGLSDRETVDLTMAMVDSGERIDLSQIPGTKVDKHSTGGVGDTTTLVLGPLVAACGAPVAKLSGRGLGHTGGTLDKLESISGFRVGLTSAEVVANVKSHGLAVAAQTASIVPADGRMYALRDVTATVESIPLIAASIMSKKIAGGADAIVLDVKVGSGAFMKTLDQARALARTMVRIGQGCGRKTVAVLTNMEEPLGFAVGNALEVSEAIATLSGHGPRDLETLCLTLGAEMLILAGRAVDAESARALLTQAISSGAGLAKLRELVSAQDGDPRVIDEPQRLPQAQVRLDLPAPASGWIKAIDALAVGHAAQLLGAGRAKKGDPIDLAVGVVLRHKVGDQVATGETLATIHASEWQKAASVRNELQSVFTICPEPVAPPQLVLDVVRTAD
ncbi:MAG: pyrimidine-nucleoside phosphorylase [Chloroflexota bacterium]